jgi:YidC/Oxa1 family membrane protein insertase
LDKKNTTLGILFIAAAFIFWWLTPKDERSMTPPPPAATAEASGASASNPAAPAGPIGPQGAQPDYLQTTADHGNAEITVLGNDFIQVRLTNYGGSIRDVALWKYPANESRTGPEVLNARHTAPMLALTDLPGLRGDTRFQLVSHTGKEAVYRAVIGGDLEVTRTYVVEPNKVAKTDPYQMRCVTTFRNLSGRAIPARQVGICLGTAEPVSDLDWGTQLVTGYCEGQKTYFIKRGELEESKGILGFGAHPAQPFIATAAPIVWATVKNQFFSDILTPDQPGVGLVTRRVRLPGTYTATDLNAYGLTGTAEFDLPAIPAHGQVQLGANFYVGPNEYPRLANTDVFKKNQDGVMQFGSLTGWASKILLLIMTGIHHWVFNWGVAIILTTLTLKIVFLPLTLMAARSSRRMQKLAPEMKTLKEKYKDNPQKQQQATIELYKKHKVNPAGACIPMLLPMPFFFGFFYMLMGSAELRLAPFLWVHDLSAPDTVGFLFGIPIRVLPLIYVVTSFIQMQLTPQPSVDNAQAKMMKFMPLLTLWIYYRYSCALSLYSTTNALFSIAQQMFVNRQKDDGDPMNQAAAAKGKGSKRPIKNVTPKRR